MQLTVKQIQNIKPAQKPFKLPDGKGLYLHVNPNGSKLWRLRYYFNGIEKTLSLGSYSMLSLAEARHAAGAARKTIHDGTDPSGARQEKKRLDRISAANTFRAVAEDWHARRKDSWEDKHAKNIINRLRKDVFKVIGDVPIADLKTPDIAAAIRPIDEDGRGEMARRALQNVGQVFQYAGQLGLVEYDPTTLLRKGFLKRRVVKSYKSIEVHQLPELVRNIRKSHVRLFPQTRIALELMLLTFVRTGELINAKWSEFDLDGQRWIIPSERMKGRKEHVVPLCRQALALLQELSEISGHREHLFPSIPRPSKPMSNATLLRALEKLGYHHIMTGHGFRSLAMTALQEKLNIDFRYIDRQLAHVPKGQVNKAYDRAQFIEQRTYMMQKWADYIDKIAV